MGAVLSNIIAITIVVLLVAGACVYIYREKKRGSHCIGCPMAGKCPGKYAPCGQKKVVQRN